MVSANRAYQQLKPELITARIQSNCKTCASMVSTVEDYKSKNQVYKGDFVTPKNVTIATFEGVTAKTFVSTETLTSTVLDAKGSVVETIPSDSGNYSFSLSWIAGQWKVTEIQSVA